MNKLNIETIKVRDWIWDNASRSYISTGIVEKIGLDYAEYKSCIDDLKAVTPLPFQDGKKVYFHESVVFSRAKFRETYPTNKITYSLDNADLIVVDKDVMLAMYDIETTYRQKRGTSIHPYLYQSSDGADVFCDNVGNGNPNVASTTRLRSFLYLEHNINGRGVLKRNDAEEMNKLWANIGKIVSVDDIELRSEVMLEEESYIMLEKLLGSNQEGNMNLAVNMLAGFDYDGSKQRVAILLYRHWQTWNRFYNKKIHITLKTMLTRLYKEFPAIPSQGAYGAQRGQNAFWYGLFSKYYKDPIVERECLKWIKEDIDCPADNLEIIVRVKDENGIIVKTTSTDISKKDFQDVDYTCQDQASHYISNYVTNDQDEKEVENLGF